MNTLEKILQEIEEEIQMKKMVWESLEKPPYNDFEQSLWIAGMRNAKEIIEKYLDENGDWIPVEERLPVKEEYLGGYVRGIPWIRRLEIAYMTDTLDYKHGYYDGCKWIDERERKIENVVAWKIHEPYKPERNEK